jgi:hypothetical protein
MPADIEELAREMREPVAWRHYSKKHAMWLVWGNKKDAEVWVEDGQEIQPLYTAALLDDRDRLIARVAELEAEIAEIEDNNFYAMIERDLNND